MNQFPRTTLVIFWLSVFIYLAVVNSTKPPRILTKKDHQRYGNLRVIGQSLGNLTAKYPYYVSGYDDEDRPILVLQWGKWDIRSIAERGGKTMREFEEATDGFSQLVRDGYFDRKLPNNSEPITKGEFIGVGDYDGLDFRQIASIKSMRLFITNLVKFASLNEEYAYGFIVNANPLAHQGINRAKPFVGSMLERTDIYGTNRRAWIPQLLKKLPRSQLHPAYGGPKDFQPVAIFNLI